MPLTENTNPLEEKKIKWHHVGLYLAGLIFILFIGLSVGVAVYFKVYINKVYPGIYLGSRYIGKMNHEEVKNILEDFNNQLFKDGLTIVLPDDNKKINIDLISNVVPDDGVEVVRIDTEKTTQEVMAAGRKGNWWDKIWQPLYYRFFGHQLPAVVLADQDRLAEIIDNELDHYGVVPNDANIDIVSSDPLAFTVVKEKTGHVFNSHQVVSDVSSALSKLDNMPILAGEQVVEPKVSEEDLPDAHQILPKIFSYGSINLNFIDNQTQARKDWVIPVSIYSHWIEAQKDGDQVVYGLSEEAVRGYLETLRTQVERPAENAKFIMEGNKVKEFKASRSGLSLDVERTYQELNTAFVERNYNPTTISKTVSLSTNIVEPEIKLADANSMGIADVIGVGVSTFYGSHLNRIKNIANAVSILNGKIIQPGEEFSTLKAAGPFVPENGYLPELVIKGEEVKREVGGGMCQIGTTLFRMAMNSGMPITERHNHSLVVNYYLDPVNHNPGTDATVYDPILDFKFLNDTGHYLLLQTEIDYKKQLLTFTLWGTPDGRRGEYTHPIVKKWIQPTGDKKSIEVDDLKPGEQSCQGLYKGAVASFTYSRTTSSSEEIKTSFESYYRPLPDICRIGKALNSTCPKGKSCVLISNTTSTATGLGNGTLSPEE